MTNIRILSIDSIFISPKILNSLFLGRRRLDSFLYSSSKNFDHMSMIKAFLKHVRYLEIVHFSLCQGRRKV